MTAAADTFEALLEMEGQMLGNKSSLSLQIHVSDTEATSQGGSIFRMQGSEGCASSKVYLLKNT